MTPTIERILNLAVRIQQIPAPTFQESARGAFVAELFSNHGLEGVERDSTGNVFGCRQTSSKKGLAPLVVSAHLDTVFPPGTPLDVRREAGRIYGPGIGDNSVAVAGLFGILWMLDEGGHELPGDLWLVANTGEEGLGDLTGMRAVVDRFRSTPAAYIVLEGMGLGSVYDRGLCVRRYRIKFKTEGGHSWAHFGRPSAVHEIARFIDALARIELPDKPRTTLNVGVLQGGVSVNTIAPRAALELDLRSESSPALAGLVQAVESLVHRFRSEDVAVSMEVIGDRPGGEIPPEHPLVTLAMRSAEKQGIEPELKIGSTDANVPLSRGLPAVCIGLTNGGGAHTTGEYILTGPLEKGMLQLLEMVTNAWGNG